jgi:mycofactocin system transcriptional regulator
MTAGRPEATSHAAIEQAAFRLFAEKGFEATTIDAIAEAVGVGRRTLFRYYRSKNDIPWGQFARTLDWFREILASVPEDLALYDAVGLAVTRFNEFPADASPSHLDRMRLILETPTLQAHSVLRYAEWRDVISQYVAGRLGLEPGDLQPQLVGHISLALAMTAYDRWLEEPDTSVATLVQQGMATLSDYVREGERPSGC